MYDARIGRWISPDRARQHYSPYLAMSNSPHMYIDPTGLVDYAFNKIDNQQIEYNPLDYCPDYKVLNEITITSDKAE